MDRLQCFGHCLHLAIERMGRDKWVDRAIGVLLSGRCLFLFVDKEERPGSCSKRTQLTPAQVGDRAAYQLGITSKDGAKSPGAGERHFTGHVQIHRCSVW
ncbi:unnamed protein product [Oncorhynchus mykiss]|uniref:Uncharacterized protein n=1 Tax=Oncorhynchus mykiss TaxID=8022 RepID=A0A060W2T1_ONCMY|nr:unnamed protein product [Oncorhynchus mykiss]